MRNDFGHVYVEGYFEDRKHVKRRRFSVAFSRSGQVSGKILTVVNYSRFQWILTPYATVYGKTE
jgi:hypothetical protein